MMRIVLVATIALAAISLAGCQQCGGAGPGPAAEAEPVHVPFWEEHKDVVAGIDVHDAFRYFSGHVKNSMNHPAMYAHTKTGSIVVTGRGNRQVLEHGDFDGALAAYRKLLVDNDYIPPDQREPEDPSRLVVVALDDLLPSERHALEVFNPEQNAVLRRVSNTTAFDYWSGNRGGAHDNPTVYAAGYDNPQLTVVGRDTQQTFDLADADRAFDAFRELLKKRGFPIATTIAAPDGR
jgi:hypothetical protein